MFKQIKCFFKLEYLLLFLVAFEPFDRHHFVVFLLFLYLYVKRRIDNRLFNYDFLLVFLWCLFYQIFGKQTYSVIHMPALICAYIIGYSMVNDRISIFRSLLVIAVGYGIEGILTVYYSGGMVALIGDEMSRSIPSLWEGMRGLTSQDALLYIFSGLIVYILTNKNIDWRWKVLSVLFELGVVYDSLRTASRSPIVYSVIIIIASLIAYNSQRIKGRSLVWLLLIGAALGIMYANDIFGIRSTVEDSLLFMRFSENVDGGASNNSRFDLQSKFWNVWTLDMWGGLHSRVGFYFHNCWLDMYAFSGIITFVAFTLLTIRFVVNMLFVYKRSDYEERSILAGVFVAFMLPMFFEPLYWAAPAYFAFFIIFYGMLAKRRKTIVLERQFMPQMVK